MSLLGALVISWVVLHPKIHEGLMAKIGLLTVNFSLMATAALVFSGAMTWASYLAAGAALRCGVAILIAAVLWRARKFLRVNKRIRRDGDWRRVLMEK